MGWVSGVQFPAGVTMEFLWHNVQTSSEAYSATDPMGTRGSYRELE